MSQANPCTLVAVPFFADEIEYDDAAVASILDKDGAKRKLEAVIEKFSKLSDFSAPELENCVRKLAAELGLKAADLIHPIRVALTGKTVGPGLFEVIYYLGLERTKERLGKFIH